MHSVLPLIAAQFMSVKEITHILKNLGEPLSDAELEAAIKAMEPDNESQVRALSLFSSSIASLYSDQPAVRC